ncbi:MAG: hypothetical protein RMH74_00395 [Candidatus Caldarchaeum sp.]|nr:hypothetical protein [Candidatus Caldarchaeum sp.]
METIYEALDYARARGAWMVKLSEYPARLTAEKVVQRLLPGMNPVES